MTWEDLGTYIAGMTKAERKQTVRFLEPYDDEAAILSVEFQHADDEIIDDNGDIIEEGQPYLSA